MKAKKKTKTKQKQHKKQMIKNKSQKTKKKNKTKNRKKTTMNLKETGIRVCFSLKIASIYNKHFLTNDNGEIRKYFMSTSFNEVYLRFHCMFSLLLA